MKSNHKHCKGNYTIYHDKYKGAKGKHMSIEFNKNLTEKDIYPYLDNEKYKNLLERFMHSKNNDSDEFIIAEILQMYVNTQENEYALRLRLLELLKDLEF